jgi:hypothetical protein
VSGFRTIRGIKSWISSGAWCFIGWLDITPSKVYGWRARYRRLTFIMLDAGIVTVSPSSLWRGSGEPASCRSASGRYRSMHVRRIVRDE